jgi:hypothetical protein
VTIRRLLEAFTALTLPSSASKHCEYSALLPFSIIIDGQFQVFQGFPSSKLERKTFGKLVRKTVGSLFAALDYCENGSMFDLPFVHFYYDITVHACHTFVNVFDSFSRHIKLFILVSIEGLLGLVPASGFCYACMAGKGGLYASISFPHACS